MEDYQKKDKNCKEDISILSTHSMKREMPHCSVPEMILLFCIHQEPADILNL